MNRICPLTSSEKRKLYVAMTRAKESLYIHCNTSIFDPYPVDGIVRRIDSTEYNEPREIALQLTHKDVVLNFFKDKKEIIFKFRSGGKLSVSDHFLTAEINGRTLRVVKFSKAFVEKRDSLREKGYEPVSARVGYIIAWQGEEDAEESAIILPTLGLKRS